MRFKHLALAGACLAISAGPAAAADIYHFDSGNSFNTVRGSGDAPLGRLTVNAATTVTQIGSLVDLDGDTDMQFLIFDAATGVNLYTSSVKAFADNGMGYKWSDALSFTFNPGTTYSVGATARSGGAFAVDFAANTVGAFTFLTGNQNTSGSFANTSLDRSLLCCDVGTAFRTSLAGAVPEPSTWALLILGFGVVGAGMRTRRSASYRFA